MDTIVNPHNKSVKRRRALSALSCFVTLLALPTYLSARDFTYTYEGQTLTYTVLDEDAKTCATKAGVQGSTSTAGNNVSGDLNLPERPKDGEMEYTLTSIGDYAFDSCRGLTSITIPNSVTTIGNYAFIGCYSLKSVTIPNSVTTIGEYAFYGCSKLTSVTIPNSVTTIGEYAFYGCSKLTSITIPNSVTTIGEGAFSECTKLTSVTIPNSVTTIGNGLFNWCSSLQQILVEENNPNFMSEDGVLFNKDQSLLIQCPGAKKDSYIIPSAVTTIGYGAFFYCPKLTSVTIPNSVITIGDYAFGNCTGLTSVTIPNSVTTIGDDAFGSCFKLTSVTIPNSVTEIGKEAFYGCTGLTEIYALPTVPPSVGEKTFREVPRDIDVYVPKGAISTYSAAEGWSEFTNYHEIERLDNIDDLETDKCNASAEYFTLQGQRVSSDRVTSGVYIVRHGDNITKTYIR